MQLSDLIELCQEYGCLSGWQTSVLDRLLAGVPLDSLDFDDRTQLRYVSGFLDQASTHSIEAMELRDRIEDSLEGE